jgi:hypothetical protein
MWNGSSQRIGQKTDNPERFRCFPHSPQANVTIVPSVRPQLLLFFQFFGVGRVRVHFVRRPLIGLLYQPRMIDDNERGAVG